MSKIKETFKKGLSNFSLKYIAMIFMVLDHIHYFFEYTGKIPLFFTWLGRMAAPLFLFCLIEGFIHTHNRRKYFLKIYGISIVMGLIQFSFYNVGAALVRTDGFFPANQMLASFSILLVVLQGIEWCTQRKWGKGLTAVILPIAAPFIFMPLLLLFRNCPPVGFLLNLLAFTVFPLHSAIMDGGTATLIMGIVLYLTHKKPKLQAGCFFITAIIMNILLPALLMQEISLSYFIWQGYGWMEVFAVIFMLCYNGQRGNGSSRLFYWFYPVHIYVLYGLSCLLYPFVS